MCRSNSRTIASLALAAGLLVAAQAPASDRGLPWRPKFAKGETVRFTGTVVGPQGELLEGIELAVEGWKNTVDFRALSREREDVTRITTRSDAAGAFAVDWAWNPELRQFAVVAFVTYRGGGGETSHELARVDVTKRLKQGSPIDARIFVAQAELDFLRRLRAFEDSLTTADERAAYQEFGLPEQTDRTPIGGRIETAWWYYRRGLVCRFRDGVRSEVQTFPPVTAAEPGARR